MRYGLKNRQMEAEPPSGRQGRRNRRGCSVLAALLLVLLPMWYVSGHPEIPVKAQSILSSAAASRSAGSAGESDTSGTASASGAPAASDPAGASGGSGTAGTAGSAPESGASGASSAAASGQGVQENTGRPLSEILRDDGIRLPGPGLKIAVDKSGHTLSLIYDGKVLKSYHVELGSGGNGDKQVLGDRKTPEGSFYVVDKSAMDPADEYLGTRWLGLSYPAAEDADRGLRQGIIDQATRDGIVAANKNLDTPPQDTALGGYIGIHGGSVPSFGSDWTWGCVGLRNADVEDFYPYVSVGTPVEIVP